MELTEKLNFQFGDIGIELKAEGKYRRGFPVLYLVEGKISCHSLVQDQEIVKATNHVFTYDSLSGELLYSALPEFERDKKWKKDYWPIVSGAYHNLFINKCIKEIVFPSTQDVLQFYRELINKFNRWAADANLVASGLETDLTETLQAMELMSKQGRLQKNGSSYSLNPHYFGK